MQTINGTQLHCVGLQTFTALKVVYFCPALNAAHTSHNSAHTSEFCEFPYSQNTQRIPLII